MDHTLIYFLLGCVAWAALLFYIFVIRGAADLGAGGKSAIVILGALLIPVLGISLWHQNEAPERLKELGFAFHEGLGSSVGVAAGTGPEPMWVYSLNSPPNSVIDFYRRPENHSGWRLTAESPNSLVFERQTLKMTLQVSDEIAAFLLFSSDKDE